MSYQSKFANESLTELFKAILELKTIEDCYRFFEDLNTINELSDMAQRLKVAQMLSEKIPYHVIAQETKASTATIARVNKSLNYGADGYQIVLKKIKKNT